MNKLYIIFAVIFILILNNKAFSQSKDSVLFHIVKIKCDSIKYDQFDFTIFNYSANPISILHSSYLNLTPIALQKLARRKIEGNTDVFSFLYSARDDLNEYESLYNDNHNGEVLLPYQKLDLHVLIPVDSLENRVLEVETVVIPDFCYLSFKKATITDPTEWYKKYKMVTYRVKL